MKTKFLAFSQHHESIKKNYRASACGPTAVASILSYYGENQYSINTLYKKLHCTKIGLPAVFLTFFLSRLLGAQWTIQRISIENALVELNNNRPVALKFDRYTNPTFWKKPYFHYHWTVLVDYKIKENDIYLIVEDLGAPQKKSRQHTISFLENKHALSFIQIAPRITFKTL